MKEFDIEKFPTSMAALDMLHSLPEDFYKDSYVMKWLLQVTGTEWDSIKDIIEGLPLQFFPETATWGLIYHEQKWQLPVKYNLGYEERRKLIYQRRDFKAPMTPYKMELYIEKILGIETHITDCHDPGERRFMPGHPNIFKATFVTENTLDVAAVSAVLNKLKQSHTVYTLEDLIKSVIDNRGLEKFLSGGINHRITIPFWGGFVFDGTWLFDGSMVFKNRRHYSLCLAIMYSSRIMPGINWKEKFAGLKHLLKTSITMKYNAGVINHYGIRTCGYCLVVMQRHVYKIKVTNKINLPRIYSRWGQHIKPDIKNRIVVSFPVFSLHIKYNAKISFRVQANQNETAGNFSAETKSKDYWLFDGSVKMDGSRKFNSIYRKETE